MTTRLLAGIPWLTTSPSLYSHPSVPLWIGYDGRWWRIAVHGIYGDKGFATASDAAQMIHNAFINAETQTN